MSEKKNLKEDELENVNGGEDILDHVFCKNCNQYFTLDYAESRKVGDGCDAYYEHKCTNCGYWDRYCS